MSTTLYSREMQAANINPSYDMKKIEILYGAIYVLTGELPREEDIVLNVTCSYEYLEICDDWVPPIYNDH